MLNNKLIDLKRIRETLPVSQVLYIYTNTECGADHRHHEYSVRNTDGNEITLTYEPLKNVPLVDVVLVDYAIVNEEVKDYVKSVCSGR